ncbi:MAG TPA: Gfo/Idh/MocA family oxidoreductase [Opitutaceae bacterium]|nr:Gfo/Idh/MocA family oxidoreductase [Opitutaceae bacterium]
MINPDSSPSPTSTPAAMNRRQFVGTLSAAGLGLALTPSLLSAQSAGSAGTPAASTGARRRRYAIVGTGSRYKMYQDAIEKDYPQHAELVAFCDTNPGRVELARERSRKNGAAVPAGYPAADFARMIAETKPDVVIVTTIDATHHTYLVRAMELGCDVLTEKPMTTTAKSCQQIIDARKRSGRQCRVAMNYRYSPMRSQVKEILMSGEIGEIRSVDFHWMLNTHHGADYFRRWHAHKKFSGGLMLHKASHHFDLVNWWLGAMPATVTATGKREFYTPAMAKRFGLTSHHERCHTCPEQQKCTFRMVLATNPEYKSIYLDQEHHDGYFRDRCVFRPDIDIEDTMNVIVGYDNGATLSYSLNAFNAWEGYTIAFNGTLGRIEHSTVEKVYEPEAAKAGGLEKGITIRVIPLRGPARSITPWVSEGGHDGGDKPMLDDIFLPSMPPDKFRRAADERGGAASVLIGIAANKCFETGKPVQVADLIKGLARPEFAQMPPRDGPLPMPADIPDR